VRKLPAADPSSCRPTPVLALDSSRFWLAPKRRGYISRRIASRSRHSLAVMAVESGYTEKSIAPSSSCSSDTTPRHRPMSDRFAFPGRRDPSSSQRSHRRPSRTVGVALPVSTTLATTCCRDPAVQSSSIAVARGCRSRAGSSAEAVACAAQRHGSSRVAPSASRSILARRSVHDRERWAAGFGQRGGPMESWALAERRSMASPFAVRRGGRAWKPELRRSLLSPRDACGSSASSSATKPGCLITAPFP
jgi:hypothetical protein